MTIIPPVRRVAVIGAGAGGLATARALLAEKSFTAVDVFEQRQHLGGVWNYTTETSIDPIPSTNPFLEETPVVRDDGTPVYPSAMYDELETNIPKSFMNFPGHPFPEDNLLFPPHADVLRYLDGFSQETRKHITLGTHVSAAKKSATTGAWELQLSDPVSGKTRGASYDALIVSAGHYNIPFTPPITGIKAYSTAHPGTILHSKSYRRASDFRDKRVLVVGNSASGFDIASQLYPVVQQPLFQSIRTEGSPIASPSIHVLPEINIFKPETAEVTFIDGSILHNVDAVIFCTGYLHSLPFITPPAKPLITNGNRVEGTYKHIFYAADPTLAFVGLPIKVVPFPISQSQACVIARVYSGRLKLPTVDVMRKWEREEIAKKGIGRAFHYHQYPADADYMDELEKMCDDAAGSGGLDPCRWREKDRWVRARVPRIKAAYVKAKHNGRTVRWIEELGFSYEEGKDGETEESVPTV